MRIATEQTVGGRPVHKMMHTVSRDGLETAMRNIIIQYLASDDYRQDPERSGLYVHVQEW